MKPALLDTGVIVALLDRSERQHRRCVEAVRSLERPLVTCEPVIAECCFLLRNVPGAQGAVMENVASGAFEIRFRLDRAAAKTKAILERYANVPADLADACLIAMAEELDTGDILSLDSDFEVFRWSRSRPFHLLIPLDHQRR
jgi:predicted nucleic acid-binding protein